MASKKTKYDLTLEKIKNNWFFVTLMLLSILIVAIGANIDALGEIKILWQSKDTISNKVMHLDREKVKNDSSIKPSIGNEPQLHLTKPRLKDTNLFNFNIVSVPSDADVYINGSYYGKTNRTIRLPQNDYDLTIKKGDIIYRDRFNIPTQEILTIDLSKYESH